MFLTISLRIFLVFLRCEKWQMKLNHFHLSLSVHNAFIKKQWRVQILYKLVKSAYSNWWKRQFTTMSNFELLKKALVWEYRISILTSVWRAFVTFLHILVIDYDVRYPIIGFCAGFIFNILKRQEMEERRK